MKSLLLTLVMVSSAMAGDPYNDIIRETNRRMEEQSREWRLQEVEREVEHLKHLELMRRLEEEQKEE